jgi:tetratricopeptide (TPR) repeat protein
MIKPAGFILALCIAIAARSESITAVQEQCYQHIAQKEYALAFDLAEQKLTKDNLDRSDRSQLYYIMGYSLRMKNHFAESIIAFDNAIEEAPDPHVKAKILLNLGAVFHYINEFEGAIKAYRRSISLSDTWAPNAYYNMSLSQIALGDYATASESLEEGLSLCNAIKNVFYTARLWNQYGIIERDMFEVSGDSARAKLARQYFKYALEVDQNQIEIGKALHYQATLDILLQDTASAIVNLRKSIDQQPNDHYRFSAILDAARLFQSSDQTEEAKNQIDSALAIFPHITRSRDEMKVFFTATRLGYDVLDWHEREFNAYATELENAQNQYRAYIGRQIRRHEILERQKFWRNIGLGLLVTIIIGLILWWFRTRITIQREIKSLSL